MDYIMKTLKLTKQQALDILNEEDEHVHVVEDRVMDTTRWSTYHRIVIKDERDGMHYIGFYSVGSTEMQDEYPWDNEKEVMFSEAVLVNKPIWELKEK